VEPPMVVEAPDRQRSRPTVRTEGLRKTSNLSTVEKNGACIKNAFRP